MLDRRDRSRRPSSTPRTRLARLRGGASLLVVATALSCGAGLRPFPLEEPMQVDPDRRHVQEMPEEYFSPFAWDGLDQLVFYPLTRFFAVDPAGPARNVNAFDEVPNSSWFENRIGLGGFSVEDARRGACPEEGLLDPSGPWTVKAAKPNGANPGFIIQGQDGRYYLLKMDSHLQPERATAADVFGSRMYHAAGFHAPCNIIVFFDPDILVMDPEAEAEDALGRDVPMTQEHVQAVLDAAVVLPDGRLRASASLFVPGRPLGPWRYQETRSDDPNDVIAHQDRRELRGGRVLAAWVNHFDAREQNTLSMWHEEEDGTSYVMHYYIDFGDGFGSDWEIDDLTRRIGFSYYLDFEHVLEDWLTLGLLSRPWDQVEYNRVSWILMYFDAGHFEPDEWRPGYPNPAFSRMQDEDGAWMARIIAFFSDAHVRAMLDEAHIQNRRYDEELYRTLLARRDRILDHYLRVRSPLTHFEVDASSGSDQVCFRDLATWTGVLDPNVVRYETRVYFGDFDRPRWTRWEHVALSESPERVCIDLVGRPDETVFRTSRSDESSAEPSANTGGPVVRPALEATPGAPPDSLERYAVVDILLHPEPGADPIPPARLHFYDLDETGFQLVGIERPSDATPPGDP